MRTIVNSIFGRLGYEPKVTAAPDRLTSLNESQRTQYFKVADRTMVWPSGVIQAANAASHIATHRIPGAIVECGVWRGGVVMAMLNALIDAGDTSRDIWLYDTYEGLPEPGIHDIGFDGRDPKQIIQTHERTSSGSSWCRASLEDVREGVCSVGYPSERLHFVKGKVEDTIPASLPGRIALLRLDTDWYESTRHEMEHLFPHLVSGGILIIDDYGTWSGSRKAVDDYLKDQPVFIARGEFGEGYAIRP